MSKKSVLFPDMYFETTVGFKRAVNVVKKEEHFCKEWKTSDLYCIESADAGTYLAFDLHKRPHYQYPVNQRNKIEKEARSQGVEYHFISQREFESKNNLYHYTNHSSVYKTGIKKYLPEIDLDEIANMLINIHEKESKKKTVNNRGVGNIIRSVGYSSQNIKFVTHVNVPTLKVTGPMPSKIITDKDGHYFMLLTKIFREVYYNKLDYQPEAIDFGRISEWGARIPKIASNHPTHDESNQPYNVFESITYALTYLGEKEDFLTCHIDTFNENKDGMNVAICLYFNFYHKQAKKYCRVALLGYFRRAISEYYARLRKRNVLRDNLKSYYLNLGNRKTLTYGKAIPKQIINKPIFHFGVACVDKCAFYSLFVHSVNILISSFKRNNRKLFLQDIIEIVET